MKGLTSGKTSTSVIFQPKRNVRLKFKEHLFLCALKNSEDHILIFYIVVFIESLL